MARKPTLKRQWTPESIKLNLNGEPVAAWSMRLLGGSLMGTGPVANLLVEWEAPAAEPARPPPPFALEVLMEGDREPLRVQLGTVALKTVGAP